MPVTLDAQAYPHIFERVVRHASFETQVALRATSRHARDLADKAMVEYIALGAIRVGEGDEAHGELEIRAPGKPFWRIPASHDGVLSERMAPLLPLVRCVDFYGTRSLIGSASLQLPAATVRKIWASQQLWNPGSVPRVVDYQVCAPVQGLEAAVRATAVSHAPHGVNYIRFDSANKPNTVSPRYAFVGPGVEDAVFVFDVSDLGGQKREDESADGDDDENDVEYYNPASRGMGNLGQLPQAVAALLASGVRVTLVGLENVPAQQMGLESGMAAEHVRETVLVRIREAAQHYATDEDAQKWCTWRSFYWGDIDQALLADIAPALKHLTFVSFGEWRATADWRDATLPTIPEKWVGWRPWDHRLSADGLPGQVPFPELPDPYESDDDFLPPIFD